MKSTEKREFAGIQKKGRLIQFRVSEVEGRMLEQLCEYFGTKLSEMIRETIRFRHEKLFAYYTSQGKKKLSEAVRGSEEELTPEQACEAAGGRVETVNGIPMCIIQISKSMKRQVPLSKPELFKK